MTGLSTIDPLLAQASGSYMMPWSFLFATALIASALDAFSRRLFHPVVMTTWFFGLAVCASMGSWSITELSAAAVCLMTPHFLICSFGARAANARRQSQPETAGGLPDTHPPEPFVLQTPRPVAKTRRRAA